jgi:hypothetical protein
MAAPDPTSAAHRAVERFVSGWTEQLGPYLSLMATINGTPQADWQPDLADVESDDQWIAAALTTSGPHHEPAPDS